MVIDDFVEKSGSVRSKSPKSITCLTMSSVVFVVW